MFSDFEKPEDIVKKDDSLFFGDEDEFDINFKSDRDLKVIFTTYMTS